MFGEEYNNYTYSYLLSLRPPIFLMLFGKIIAVYSDNRMKSTQCEHNAVFNAKAGITVTLCLEVSLKEAHAVH
jgi:hypothetical protein